MYIVNRKLRIYNTSALKILVYLFNKLKQFIHTIGQKSFKHAKYNITEIIYLKDLNLTSITQKFYQTKFEFLFLLYI